MRFAIVTPSYNKVRYLRRCVESILDQPYDGVDYCLLDNCSNDGTAQVLAELQQHYGARFKTIVAKDSGQSEAINRGFGLVQGELMGWLNADDFYVADTFAQVAQYFRQHPEVGMIYGHARILDGEYRVLGNFPTMPPDLRVLQTYDYIPQPSAFWRREVWDAVGPLDEQLHYTMDWDLFLRMSARFPIGFVDAVLSEAVQDGTHKTATGGPKKVRELALVGRRHSGWTNTTNLFCQVMLVVYAVLQPWLKRPQSAAAAKRLLERIQAIGMTVCWRVLGRHVMA